MVFCCWDTSVDPEHGIVGDSKASLYPGQRRPINTGLVDAPDHAELSSAPSMDTMVAGKFRSVWFR